MIYWLAIGAFAVGTEAFMISAILPEIAGDLQVSMQSVGGLVALFFIRLCGQLSVIDRADRRR